MNISCAFPQHQSPPRGGKAITSQSYGFFPFAVFFLISLSFATAEKKSQARGEKLKSNFLTPQQTEFVLGDGLRGQEKLLASLWSHATFMLIKGNSAKIHFLAPRENFFLHRQNLHHPHSRAAERKLKRIFSLTRWTFVVLTNNGKTAFFVEMFIICSSGFSWEMACNFHSLSQLIPPAVMTCIRMLMRVKSRPIKLSNCCTFS